MKRRFFALLLGFLLLTPAANGVELTLNGTPFDVGDAPACEGVAYVSLRAMVERLCPEAEVSWQEGRAVARTGSFLLTAQPGEYQLIYNEEVVSLSAPVLLEEGRTLVPLRTLAELLDVVVAWNQDTGVVELTAAGAEYAQQVYWLSRVISAESQGECWEGKIAVGNVVLNRVSSPDFPDTIYGVIFDDRWGGQFEPVRNRTIYNTPTDESVRAAVACLAGENTVGDSLYFLAPALTDNHWTMSSRTYVTTIGVHWFYL